MANRKALNSEDKLAALRKADPARRWLSLDDRCTCVLCERTFNGRQIDVAVSALGRVRLRCPSDGCAGTPREWVHPGNPLVSQKAWRDWERVLNTGTGTSRRKTFKTPTTQTIGATA
jgi:hypothetical protein